MFFVCMCIYWHVCVLYVTRVVELYCKDYLNLIRKWPLLNKSTYERLSHSLCVFSSIKFDYCCILRYLSHRVVFWYRIRRQSFDKLIKHGNLNTSFCSYIYNDVIIYFYGFKTACIIGSISICINSWNAGFMWLDFSFLWNIF